MIVYITASQKAPIMTLTYCKVTFATDEEDYKSL